ncbi:hypothetical protein [Streptomyces mirabilis]
MTKPRLTRDEHDDLGRTLAGIRDELNRRTLQLANAYPRTGPEATPYKRLANIVDELDAVRAALDHALFREHPDTGETTVYYPYPEDRSIVRPPDHIEQR